MNTSAYFPGQGLFNIFNDINETVSNVSEVVQNSQKQSTTTKEEHISEVDGSEILSLKQTIELLNSENRVLKNENNSLKCENTNLKRRIEVEKTIENIYDSLPSFSDIETFVTNQNK
jgi:predicted RNase H-like nuclease (RuvC/YqgF family)